MRPDDGETAAYLLTCIQQQNLLLTADQLRRLHLEGLIARPLQDHPKGTIGSETVYPKGTGDVLLAICTQREPRQSFAAVAWQLWWEGYPIPLARIRTDLRNTVEEWERLRRQLCLPGTRTFTKFAWKMLRKVAFHRFREPFLNQARKRVGTTSFDTFTRVLLEIATGNFRGYTDDGAGAREEERQILEKGFGLSRTSIDRALRVDWIENLEDALVKLSRIVASNPWGKWLDQASDTELLRNRDELRLLLTAFASLSAAIDDIRRKTSLRGQHPVSGTRYVGKEAASNCVFVLVHLALVYGHPIDELLLSARQWLEEGLPAYTALRQLQVEVPVTRSLLTPRKRKAAMRNERAQMQYFAECQAFYEQHREELMAFWQRHPEWYAPDTEKQADAPAC